MGLMPEKPAPKQATVKYKMINLTDGIIEVPVQAPVGSEGSRRARPGSTYRTLGAKCDRGIVGRPQPEIELTMEEFSFASKKRVIEKMIKENKITFQPIGG